MLGQAEPDIRPMEYRTILVARVEPNGSGTSTERLRHDFPVTVRDEVEPNVQASTELRDLEGRDFERELDAVRDQAFEAGRKSLQDQYSAALNEASAHLTRAIEEFRLSRDLYLANVEREIVQLSLAIAERILHRQAQIDPLLLSGAVRVVLGQLAESTEVRLKVPATDQEMWADMLRLMPNLPLRPELVLDERMKAGDCSIETHLGSIDIGVPAQLAEIERGFFDLLEHRGSFRSESD